MGVQIMDSCGHPDCWVCGLDCKKTLEQPDPIPNNSPFVVEEVIKDLNRRAEVGEKKYGVKLQPNNGRDALLDAYEEAQDLCLYLKQAMMERDNAST